MPTHTVHYYTSVDLDIFILKLHQICLLGLHCWVWFGKSWCCDKTVKHYYFDACGLRLYLLTVTTRGQWFSSIGSMQYKIPLFILDRLLYGSVLTRLTSLRSKHISASQKASLATHVCHMTMSFFACCCCKWLCLDFILDGLLDSLHGEGLWCYYISIMTSLALDS